MNQTSDPMGPLVYQNLHQSGHDEENGILTLQLDHHSRHVQVKGIQEHGSGYKEKLLDAVE